MGTIVAGGILATAVIEISGLPAAVVLLLPFAVLLIVVALLRRPRTPRAGTGRSRSILSAISATGTPAPATAGSGPAAIAEPPPDWAERIASAEGANDHAALAGLYLSFARAEVAEARHASAAELLRSCIRAATKSRNPAAQAEARLELAELARAAGDLTTACEHWQIARALFHQMSEQARLGEIERRMQQHGCPTDWVLNDF